MYQEEEAKNTVIHHETIVEGGDEMQRQFDDVDIELEDTKDGVVGYA